MPALLALSALLTLGLLDTARTVPLLGRVFDGRKVTFPLLEVLATLEGERQTVHLMIGPSLLRRG